MKIMKIINIYIFIFLLLVSSLYAQTPRWVSTEVQNRVAVLEDFTSAELPQCAAGHKEAYKLAERYSNNFIVMNIYCNWGSWGSGSDTSNQNTQHKLDLTTDEGLLIYNNSGDSVFPPSKWSMPCGAINRSTKPWALTPDEWESTAVNIMNQTSVVNVYVVSQVNYAARELTVEVEYYYTDDSPVSENYLTVMLLQNEILGYQYNDQLENPEYIYDKNRSLYRHMHVLRKVISNDGAWGDTIVNTKKGSYEYRKYTVTLPDSIKNVPLDLTNLEVVAFVSESKADIYTGCKTKVNVPGDFKTDLTVEDITEYNNTLKFETIYPKIKVTNNSDVPVTKFDAAYTIANIQSVLNLNNVIDSVYDDISISQKYDTILTKTETYSGKINKGESIIVEFPAINKSDFNYSSLYTAQASVYDIYSNDIKPIDFDVAKYSTEYSGIGLIDTSFRKIELTFENTDPSSIVGLPPSYLLFDYSQNPYFTIYNGSCGAKNTKNAVLFLLESSYKVFYKPGYIMFGEIECNGNSKKVLSYYYAYSDGSRNGSRPRIVVEISRDLGKTWEKISDILCEETGQPSNTNKLYIPTSNEYKLVQINLDDFLKEKFIIRIGGIPGTRGNALWIDEISIVNPEEVSIKEDLRMTAYPNPTTNILYINNNNLLGEEYEIYDMSGKLIIKDINNSNIINVGNLSTGTYSLKIKDSIFNFIKE